MTNNSYEHVAFFGLNASKKLAQEICNILKVPLQEAKVNNFADGEISVESLMSVRGKDVYVIQSTSFPVNENLMQLLIFIDALKRASANKINVVIPYFGYARQDRKAKGRQPITAKLVANMLTGAGADRIMLVDIHSSQIQGFFDIPVDDLWSSHDFAEYFLEKKLNNVVVVSPDHGGVTRARHLTTYLPGELAVVVKKRPEPNVSEVEFVLGDIKDKNCIIIDDMIDTGGTIVNAAKALKDAGAKTVYIAATHPIFSGKAVERLKNAVASGIVNEVVVTNSIELLEAKKFTGLKIISIAGFLAKMINASINCESLSEIYATRSKKLSNLQE
ncbi:ribose-phosphate pyrophosphokinase [Spiroplasma endosymbiont of Lonchoptera lutea]|uniref:ribose-phosphate pyrophosphokinase n=1 Tax=Spiroplasma endosymbiont of Lonchoptera lutea TaxID=3066297 RepID=UPI0030CB12FA